MTTENKPIGQSFTHKLYDPFTFGGKDYTALTMRNPRVRDKRLVVAAHPGDPTKDASVAEKQELLLLANLCDMTVDAMGEVSLRDYLVLQQAALDFQYPPSKS